MDTNTCSPPSVASTSGSVGISASTNGGTVFPTSSSSPSSSVGNVASTNCPAYSTTGVSATCNIANTQMTILQPGTGLNTSGGTIQLVTTMETSNSQQDEFIANSTSNNSAANLPQGNIILTLSCALLFCIILMISHILIIIIHVII